MASKIQELRREVFEICSSIEDLHKLLSDMYSVGDNFDTLKKGFRSIHNYRKVHFGLFMSKLIPFLYEEWPFSKIENKLGSYLIHIQRIKSSKEHIWLFFFKLIPPKELLNLLKRLKRKNATYLVKKSEQIRKYSTKTRFSKHFENKYKKTIDDFLSLGVRIEEVIKKLEYLVVLYGKLEGEIEKQIDFIFSKRIRMKFNLSKYNKQLKGNLYLVVIFDCNGRHLFSGSDDQEKRDWINFFLYICSTYDFTFEELFKILEEMFDSLLVSFINLDGELLSEIYLESKVDMTLTFYIVELLRDRGYVIMKNKRKVLIRGIEKELDFQSDAKNWYVFMNVNLLAKYVPLFLKKDPWLYNLFNEFLVHELAHITDRKIASKSLLITRFRDEGIAMFTEYVFKLLDSNYAFKIYQKYLKEQINDFKSIRDFKGQKEMEIYKVGFYMCLSIFAADLVKKNLIEVTDFNKEFMKTLPNRSDFMEVFKMAIKSFRSMSLYVFFRRYKEAVITLGLVPIFSDELLNVIIERMRRSQ